MKKKLFIIPSVLFLLILSIFFYLLMIERNHFELPSNLLNKNVPIFETESLLKNKNFVSSQEFGNEIILVNFFATWCVPCREEHVFIKRFSNEKGITVLLEKASVMLNAEKMDITAEVLKKLNKSLPTIKVSRD